VAQRTTEQGIFVKKTLFSLAFVAASGAYVAAANHVLPLPGDDGAILPKQAAANVDLSPVAPAASIQALVTSSLPASSEPVPIIGEVESDDPAPPVRTNVASPAPSSSSQAPTIVADATPSPLPMPPLPRPRPTPPAVAIQPAAASDVAASSGGGYRDGTYTGNSENAYYGRVQVQVIVANHLVANVKVLDYPSDRRTSRYINGQALPLLQQEVIGTDGTSVDIISGATLTSEAYIRSLDTALQQAGVAGA